MSVTVSIDPHVHSDESYDGHEPVELILEHAADIDLDAVVITDHDVMAESRRAAELAPDYGLLGIPGVEVTTAHGHLLAIGVDDMPPHREPLAETVDWIRDRGGVAVVPHPFQRSRHGIRRRHLADCDAIEVFNAWLFTGYRNRRARRFAAANDYPGLAASDAHTLEYVGRAYTDIEVDGVDDVADVTADDVLDAIREGTTTVEGKRAPIPMAAKHYGIAATRKSRYYAKVGAIKSGTTAKWTALRAGSIAKITAIQGAHRLGRVVHWVR